MEHEEFVRTEKIGINGIQMVLSKTILALPDPIPMGDIEALSELSVMRVYPTGKEDVKGIMRAVSNPTLNKMANLSRDQMDDPITGHFFHFIYLEWCFRNGLMCNDWEFTWVNEKEGNVKYVLNQTTRTATRRMHNLCLLPSTYFEKPYIWNSLLLVKTAERK